MCSRGDKLARLNSTRLPLPVWQRRPVSKKLRLEKHARAARYQMEGEEGFGASAHTRLPMMPEC